MAKLNKKRKAAEAKIDKNKVYSLKDASTLVKDINTAKFDASVDLHIRLGVDPKKAEAKGAGADYFGLEEFIQKIEGGWTDVDVIIATPSVMPKIGKLGKILGPRNLMPNPKTGTVTNNVAEAVNEVKGGKIAFKVDKAGIVHASIGRVSFPADKIAGNSHELINAVIKLKPATAKGIYVKGVSMASTMSPGITIDTKTL